MCVQSGLNTIYAFANKNTEDNIAYSVSSTVLDIFTEVFPGPYMDSQYMGINNDPIYAVEEHIYGDVSDIREQLLDIKNKAKHCYPYTIREVAEYCYELRVGYHTPIEEQRMVKKAKGILFSEIVYLSYIRMDDNSVCCHIGTDDDAEISCFDNPLEHYNRLSELDVITPDDVKDFKQPY
jgi:hypothetical protein